MPIKIDGPKKDNLCRGGNSFNERPVVETADEKSFSLGPHEPERAVNCRRCHQYMGCRWCAQKPDELVCRNCHDWATDEAERRHGKMDPRKAAPRYTAKRFIEQAQPGEGA
jgi:hypothetical protein